MLTFCTLNANSHATISTGNAVAILNTTGAGDIMLNIQSLIRFPIPKIKNSDMRLIERMIDQISEKYDPMLQSTIDSMIFSLYGFDKDEIKVINDV